MTLLNFATLKKSSSSFDRLNKEIEKINTPTNNNDDNRFWKAEVDKAGNGYAVIRLLPAPQVDGEDALPWVRIWNHGFKGPGGWYIENSLSTLGKKDPVGEYNVSLWNSGIEANKRIVQGTQDRPGTKRRLNYISNIFVVQDPKNPQNEGKVFLFKYGKKIFDKLSEAMNPQFEDEKPVNPFDFWKGADFKLKIRRVEGYTNYDKSEFDKPAELFGGDEKELQKVWEKEHSLAELVSTKHFKTYEELKERLDRVLGSSVATNEVPQQQQDDAPRKLTSVDVLPKKETKPVLNKTPVVEEEDNDLAYFKKIAEEIE